MHKEKEREAEFRGVYGALDLVVATSDTEEMGEMGLSHSL